MPKEKYIIELIRPKGASVSAMKKHIHDSVKYWGGSFDPEDPFFDGLENKVTKAKHPYNY